jgi:hypothetical protein
MVCTGQKRQRGVKEQRQHFITEFEVFRTSSSWQHHHIKRNHKKYVFACALSSVTGDHLVWPCLFTMTTNLMPSGVSIATPLSMQSVVLSPFSFHSHKLSAPSVSRDPLASALLLHVTVSKAGARREVASQDLAESLEVGMSNVYCNSNKLMSSTESFAETTYACMKGGFHQSQLQARAHGAARLAAHSSVCYPVKERVMCARCLCLPYRLSLSNQDHLKRRQPVKEHAVRSLPYLLIVPRLLARMQMPLK